MIPGNRNPLQADAACTGLYLKARAALSGSVPGQRGVVFVWTDRIEQANAHRQPAYSQAAQAAGKAQQSTGHAGVPAEAGRVHARLYNDTEEAELRSA